MPANACAPATACLLYFIAYPLGRLWVEAFRPDAWVMGTLATAQWIAIGSIIICTVLLIIRHWKWSWREHPEDSLVSLSVHSTTIPYSEAHQNDNGKNNSKNNSSKTEEKQAEEEKVGIVTRTAGG